MRALVLALACLGLVGTASAHAAFDAGAPLNGASVHVEVSGAPMPVALTPLKLVVRGDAPDVTMRLVAADGRAFPWFTPSSGIVFPAEGDWTIEARSGADVARFPIHVWPEGPFVRAVGERAATGVVVAGSDTSLVYELTDAAGTRRAWPEDIVVRVDGAPVDVAQEEGRLVLQRPWAAGEHVVTFSSATAGLAQDARPPTRILAVTPEEAAIYGLDAGDAGGFPLVSVLAGLAALVAIVGTVAFTRARLSSRSCSR